MKAGTAKFALAALATGAAQAGDWVGDLPGGPLASGAEPPALEEIWRGGVLVPGDFSRFGRVWGALERGENARIAVIGGSITQGARASSPEKSWGRLFCDGWRRAFPGARIDFVNAGIGATGSQIGAFRLKRDVLDKAPDVVAVEFAVNDANSRECAESFEGVVRQLLADPRGIAVILLGMADHRGGNAQEWQARVAEHYGVPFVSWRDALYVPFVKTGRIAWSDIAADSVHPNDAGHAYAAALLNRLLADRHAAWMEAGRPTPAPPPLPEPLFGTSFDGGEFLRMADAKILESGGFFPLRDQCWGEGLACTNAGARIRLEVEGATVALLYRIGRDPYDWGKMDVLLDGEPVARGLDCYRDQWWWKTPALFLCKDRPGRHVVEVVALPEKNPASGGYGCHLTGLLVSSLQGTQK